MGWPKAYPMRVLQQHTQFTDTVAGTDLYVSYDRSSQLVLVQTPEGEVLPSVKVYWFAWQAFYPHTESWAAL